MIDKSYFFSPTRLASWKKEYLVHIFEEAISLSKSSKISKDTSHKIQVKARNYFQLNAIANLQSLVMHLNDFEYFRDMDAFVKTSKVNEIDLKKILLDNLENDFDSESIYSLQFIELISQVNLKWKKFAHKTSQTCLKSALKVQKDLLPNLNLQAIKKYKHRIKSPSQTGKQIEDSKYFHIKILEFNKLKQLLGAKTWLKEIWPYGFEFFVLLTDRIHLIRSKNLVSYSHFTEQGITYMNLWGRDSLDTLDDIIHENSHHHLNLILKKYKILKHTFDEEIYFSPWRHSLRPLYAILHSVFTFTWGAMLFEKLLQEDAKIEALMPKRFHEKVKLRFLEEAYHLDFSLQDLKSAMQKGDFTAKGNLLVSELNEINSNHLVLSKAVMNHASLSTKTSIQNLKKNLALKRKEFSLIY